MSPLFRGVTQMVPTEQAMRIGVASLRDFELLLSLPAHSKATETLHELQHTLVRQQLSVMPRTEEENSSARGKTRCRLHQQPRCEKIKLQRKRVAAKEVEFAGGSARGCLVVVFAESRSTAGCQTSHARRFQS